MPGNELNYKANRAPFLRSGDTTRGIMLDVIVALMFPLAFSCYFYGLKAVFRVLFAGGVCLAADFFTAALAGRKTLSSDMSSLVTGFILTMLLPADVSFVVLLAGCLFAILVAKAPFGGIGNNIFNPAAAGMAFITVVCSDSIFWYPQPFSDGTLTRSLSYVLKFGGVPSVSLTDIAVGNYCGPVGATNILILIGCFVFLCLKRTVSARISLSYIATVGIIALLFPRISCTPLESVVYELTSGYIAFAAVFMITDPVTAPKHGLSKTLYGITVGILSMLFRHFGGYEQGVCFAILLSNALAHSFDRLTLYLKARRLSA